MDSSLILNIETSGRFCSVALSKGGVIVAEKEDTRDFSHSETLAPFARDVMDMAEVTPSDLDAISISSGPGSYTGLRVGTSFAKAMCFALDIPLIAVDTLEAIANAAIVQTDADAIYVPNIDARRMEVYLAVFDRNGIRIKENSAAIIEPDLIEQLVPDGGEVVFCGNGSAKGAEILESPAVILYDFEVHARHLVPIAQRKYVAGKFADVVQFKPEYLKSPNITVSTKPQF